jgi:hypothetical protein
MVRLDATGGAEQHRRSFFSGHHLILYEAGRPIAHFLCKLGLRTLLGRGLISPLTATVTVVGSLASFPNAQRHSPLPAP